MTRLIDIEGIGEKYAEQLKAAGITNAKSLLEKGASAKGRQALAEASGITETLILKWVNHVDLFRIKGIGSEYSELLERAGVDSVPELAQRRPDHLLEKMTSLNAEKKLVRRLPVLAQVEQWIEQARSLPKIVTH